MKLSVNIVLTALIAGLAAAAPVVDPASHAAAIALGALAAALKVLDGILTPGQPS